MKKHDQTDRSDTTTIKSSRTTRLHALLFTGAALGTTLLTLGAVVEPKLPPFYGQ